MKGFLLGVFMTLTLNQVAHSLDVQLTPISVRDFFAGTALAGLLSNNSSYNNAPDLAFRYADAMMARRNK